MKTILPLARSGTQIGLRKMLSLSDRGTYYTKRITFDSENERIKIEYINNETGEPDAASHIISIDVGDLPDPEITPLEIKLREFTWKDKDTCEEMSAYVLMSEPKAVE